MKALGYAVTTNDFLRFPAVIAQATIENQHERLTPDEIETICGPPADDRDFVRRTFDGLYFTADDRVFLDSAWSHIDQLYPARQPIAIAALVLAAARKQPRGVFTVTDLRYDDGRRDLRLPLRDHFRERLGAYHAVIFDSGRDCRANHGEVFDLAPQEWDVVYLDPPYAPPRDDNYYIKRYHFLEGLSCYWRGQTILQHTKTRKLAKRYTPFSYKGTIADGLRRTFTQFRDSTIVLSYSSNAVPDASTIHALLARPRRMSKYAPSTTGTASARTERHSAGSPRNTCSSGDRVSGVPTFQAYLASLTGLSVHADPTVDTPHSKDIRAAAASLKAEPGITVAALAAWLRQRPAWVPVLGLAVGLSQERLRNALQHRFHTTGWVSLARTRPETWSRCSTSSTTWCDSYPRSAAGHTISGTFWWPGPERGLPRLGAPPPAARVEDEIQQVAERLGLPYQLRTRFTGRNGRTAACDLAIPGWESAAIAVAPRASTRPVPS